MAPGIGARILTAPRPRSSLRKAGLMVLVSGVIVCSLIACTWLFFNEQVSDRVEHELNARVFKSDSTRIKIGKVGGSLIRGFRVEGFRLECLKNGSWFPFAAADTVWASYRPLELLRGRVVVEELHASGFIFELQNSETGFLMPRIRSKDTPGEGEGGGGSGPDIAIRRGYIRNGLLVLDLPAAPLKFDDIEGALALEWNEGGLAIHTHSLTASLNDTLGNVALDQGSVIIHEGVVLDSLSANWDGSRMLISGEPGPEGGLGTLTVYGESVSGIRLMPLLDQENLEPGFVEQGSITFDLAGRTGMSFVADGRGHWGPWSAHDISLEGVLSEDRLILDHLSARGYSGRLTEGRVVVPLDQPTVLVDARVQGVDLAEVMTTAELTPVPGFVSGRFQVSFPDRANPREQHEVHADLEPSVVYRVPIESGFARLRGGLTSGWTVDSLRVVSMGSEAGATGLVGSRDSDLEFSFDGDLQSLREVVRLDALEGQGKLRGRLVGPADSLLLMATGTVEDVTLPHVQVRQLQLLYAEGLVSGTRDLSLVVETRAPLYIGGIPFDSARGALAVGENKVVLTDFAMERGDSSVVLQGELIWDPEVMLSLSRADLTLGEETFTMTDPAEMTFTDGTFVSEGITIATNQGTISASGLFDRTSQYLECELSLEEFNPASLMNEDFQAFLDIDRIDGYVSLKGAIPTLDGSADVYLEGVDMGGFILDSLRTNLEVADRRVTIRDFSATRGSSQVQAAGEIIMPAALYTVLEREVFGPALSPDSTKWNVSVYTQNMELGQWLQQIPRSRRPVGSLSGKIDINGTSAHPVLAVDAQIDRFLMRGFNANKIRLLGTYDDREAGIDSLVVWHDGVPVYASGTLPLDLSMEPLVYSLPERPMNLLISGENGSLRSLEVTPWIDEAVGKFTGHIEARGTPRFPHLTGEFRMVADTLRLVDRDEVLTDATAWLVMDGQEITIVAAQASMEGGAVSARGTYRINASESETYEITVNLDNAVVRERGRYAARVFGDLTVRPKVVDGLVYPNIEGRIELDRIEYIGSLQPQDTATIKRRAFIYDVFVSAPDKMYVDNNAVRAELRCELQITQTPGPMSIQGNMEILQGTYLLFFKKFDIKSGTLTFQTANSILPHLDIDLETIEQDAVIGVHISGRSDERVIEFTAYDPENGDDLGYSQEDIIRSFAVGSLAASQMIVGGSQYLLRDVEDALLDQIGLIDDLSIGQDYVEGEVTYKVQLRKYLTPELSLRYEQGLSRYFDQQIAVEYRLGRRLFLRAQTIRERLLDTSTFSQRYNLDVTARHEY